MPPYSQAFYAHVHQNAQQSAQQVVPEVLRLSQARSVIDVGCGTGDWLAAFARHGITDYCGVDGVWAQKELQIPHDHFLCRDLTQPLTLERRFDLVVSLEVAEHLPPECADSLVDSLVRLGPIILFSAAVPQSGGTHHVNEQWPQYWAEKFLARDYVAIDCLRKKFWLDRRVAWFYSQNMFFYVHKDALKNYPELDNRRQNNSELPLALVHPGQFAYMNKMNLSVGDVCRWLIRTIPIAIKKHSPFRRTKNLKTGEK